MSETVLFVMGVVCGALGMLGALVLLGAGVDTYGLEDDDD